jgi:hypothetical protein
LTVESASVSFPIESESARTMTPANSALIRTRADTGAVSCVRDTSVRIRRASSALPCRPASSALAKRCVVHIGSVGGTATAPKSGSRKSADRRRSPTTRSSNSALGADRRHHEFVDITGQSTRLVEVEIGPIDLQQHAMSTSQAQFPVDPRLHRLSLGSRSRAEDWKRKPVDRSLRPVKREFSLRAGAPLRL